MTFDLNRQKHRVAIPSRRLFDILSTVTHAFNFNHFDFDYDGSFIHDFGTGW